MVKLTSALLLLASTSLLSAPALAETAVIDGDMRYLVGLGLRHGPDYWGSASSSSGLKLMWAVKWGRWRVSTSGASGLMAFGSDAVGPGPGASRELFRSDKLKVGFGLRLDNGRSGGESDNTDGLPEVARTLRGRIYASYELAPGWQLGAAVNQDLLGKQGGSVWSAELSHQLFHSRNGELTAGFGITAADGANMRSYFGVPADSAAALRLGRSYTPGAGLREAGFGMKYTRAYAQRWVGYVTVGASSLLGPAADSPINQRTVSTNWGVGLAYRN